MQVAEHVQHVQRAGAELRSAGQLAGLDAPVPSCPHWTVASLLRHTARVYHWCTLTLRQIEPRTVPFERPEDDAVVARYAAALDQCLTALRTTPPSLVLPTMYPADSAVAFFARRMAHETAIHRVDAELAAGCGVSEFDAYFAADGVDELLIDMGRARFSTDGLGRSFTVTLTPLDLNRAWTVNAGPSSYQAEPVARDNSDLNLFGSCSDLYRWIWNRAGDDEVSLRGDLTVADIWRQRFTINARDR